MTRRRFLIIGFFMAGLFLLATSIDFFDPIDDISKIIKNTNSLKSFSNSKRLSSKFAKNLAIKIRLHANYSNFVASSSSKDFKFFQFHFNKLEISLFADWLPNSIFKNSNQIKNMRKNQKGLVMSVGNKQVKVAIFSLRLIRHVYQCHYPIEIFFNGDKDLSKKNQLAIKNLFTNIQMRNFEDYLGKNDQIKQYSTKPFALLLSSSKLTMLIDADSVLALPPQSFFDIPKFKNNGMLFYRDRSLPHVKNRVFHTLLESILPYSDFLDQEIYYEEKHYHTMESGLLLLDLEKHFYPALTAALLNTGTYRNLNSFLGHGDKESFWIAMAIHGIMPVFSSGSVGSVGKAEKVAGVFTTFKIVSSQLAHSNEDGTLLSWFNGAIFKSKTHPKTSGLVDLSSFGIEDEDSYYTFKGGACLHGLSGVIPVSLAFQRDILGVFDWYMRYLRETGEVGEKVYLDLVKGGGGVGDQ